MHPKKAIIKKKVLSRGIVGKTQFSYTDRPGQTHSEQKRQSDKRKRSLQDIKGIYIYFSHYYSF